MDSLTEDFTLFRPSQEHSADLRLQVHRLLSLLGAVLIPLFGLLHSPRLPFGLEPLWVDFGIAGLFGGLFLGSYAWTSIRLNYATWMQGLLSVVLAWSVWVVSLNHFGGGYDLGLLLTYAVFIAVVGFGARTVHTVFWFSSIGLCFAAVGLIMEPSPQTTPSLLLMSMATVAFVEGITLQGRLSTWRRLREREERLQWAQRLAQLGYWTRDLENGELEWSRETRNIFGWSDEVEVTYDSFMEVVHPEDRERLRAAQEAVLVAGRDLDIKYRVERPSGEERVVHERGALRRDERGRPSALMGAVLDITDREKTKRALRKSEKRFRGLFEEAALGIALLKEDGVLLEANRALESMLGFDAGALRGLHFEDVTHPEDMEADRRLYEELIRGERDHYQIEKRYTCRDGDVIWGRLTVSSREGPDGLQVIGMVENINEEKKRKEKLRLFRKAVEQAGEAVLITEGELLDEPGPRIQYANPAFTEMTGYDTEDVVGETPRLLQGPETESWVLRRLRRRLEQGRRFEGEAINYRKDGAPFVNHWSIAPVRDEDGTITHWVSVQRDVTERRRMGQRLLEVQDEERRRIDEEIHDEMGGLLTTLQLTVDRARVAAEKEGASTDHFDEIVDLLDELSGVARTISRRLHPGDLDDHGLARTLSSLATKMEDRHDLSVEVQCDLEEQERFSSLVEMTAYRVVQEALVNVVRHAQTDSATVQLLKDDDQLRIHVVDDGKGFEPEDQEEKTYGLAGMTERVERLNGELWIRTSPGEGARISASLPLTSSVLPRTSQSK